MSKIVTARYEYAVFDDAAPGSNLAAVPPTYPPTLDQYTSTTVGNTAAGYGVANVNSTGAAQSVALPAVAGGYIQAASTNTTMVACTFTSATTPGGPTQSVTLLCGPGQLISLPAAWVSPTFTMAACNPSGSASVTAPFSAQLLWSF